MTKVMTVLLVLISLIVNSSSGRSIQMTMPVIEEQTISEMDRINEVCTRMMYAESDGYHYDPKTGEVLRNDYSGATGRWQITSPGLAEFNRITGHKLTMKHVENPCTNEMVGRFLSQYLIIRHGYIDGVNSYNVGPGDTLNSNMYNLKYLRTVLGRDMVNEWLKGAKIKWHKWNVYIVTFPKANHTTNLLVRDDI